jgi:hypothetical protein
MSKAHAFLLQRGPATVSDRMFSFNKPPGYYLNNWGRLKEYVASQETCLFNG